MGKGSGTAARSVLMPAARMVATVAALATALGLSASSASAVPTADTAATPTLAVPTEMAPPRPANGSRQSAQAIAALPTTLEGTTVGAVVEAGEPPSECSSAVAGAVWYSAHLAEAERIAVELSAGGALEAVVGVFRLERSQLVPVACRRTGARGHSQLTFKTSKSGTYEIRVGALEGSQRAGFTLSVFSPTPAQTPPGVPLPQAGATGHVDRIQYINAAYSVTLHEGVSYLISLTNETSGACVHGGLYAPGTRSFESSSPVLSIHCSGYQLFTPGAAKGGVYSFQVTPSSYFVGAQDFHVAVIRAGPGDTAPGLALPNYFVARGRLDSRATEVLRLYRIGVTTHSNLTLKLSAAANASFNLQLRGQNGNVIACECAGSGSKTIATQVDPGTYYAIVSTRGPTEGNFTLTRQSRTITITTALFVPTYIKLGTSASVHVTITHAASGPVEVEIQRFDPVFGWQFYRDEHVVASGGAVTVGLSDPAIGIWRARAHYLGSLVDSPSEVGFTYLFVS